METLVNNGIQYLNQGIQILEKQLNEKLYGDLYKIYELTFHAAFKYFPKQYDEVMFEIMQKMDNMNKNYRMFRKRKRSGGSKKNKNKNKNKNKKLRRRTKKRINV